MCNFNDSCDYMDKEYDPKHPAYQNEMMHDRLRYLDDEELDILNELKDRLMEYRLSDNTLIRFLTARGYIHT